MQVRALSYPLSMVKGTKLIVHEDINSGIRIFLKRGYGDGHYGTLLNEYHCHP